MFSGFYFVKRKSHFLTHCSRTHLNHCAQDSWSPIQMFWFWFLVQKIFCVLGATATVQSSRRRSSTTIAFFPRSPGLSVERGLTRWYRWQWTHFAITNKSKILALQNGRQSEWLCSYLTEKKQLFLTWFFCMVYSGCMRPFFAIDNLKYSHDLDWASADLSSQWRVGFLPATHKFAVSLFFFLLLLALASQSASIWLLESGSSSPRLNSTGRIFSSSLTL